MILKKLFIFIVLAIIFYLIAVFINWNLDIQLWGARSRVVYMFGAVITAFRLIVEDV